MAGNLSAEVGELQGKVNKAQRKGLLKFTENGHIVWVADSGRKEEFMVELAKEAGDVLPPLPNNIISESGTDLSGGLHLDVSHRFRQYRSLFL